MTSAAMAEIEAPSGKTAGDENFPVGSWLIAPRLRRHVMAFYGFARAADDIADSPDLAAEEKLRRLQAFEAGLEAGASGPPAALRLRDSLEDTGVSKGHALTLLAAFKLDAVKSRHESWEELDGYCALSAHPVGRYMLDLHGEGPATHAPSDALTAALQVLNHLQDIADDYRGMDRIYLPGEWLRVHGVSESDLAAPRSSDGLRRVIDRCLDGCDQWLTEAAPLPGLIRSRRLGAEAAVILGLAVRLAARLRTEDPLTGRVRLRRTDWVAGAVTSLRRLVRPG